MKGFRDFILRGNVVDLAIAVVIGAAFGTIVTAFVKDLITPLIAALGGQPDFNQIYFTLNGSKFMIGDFINTVISFLIIALVVYFFVVLPVNRLMERFKPQVTPAPRKYPRLSFLHQQGRQSRYSLSFLHLGVTSPGLITNTFFHTIHTSCNEAICNEAKKPLNKMEQIYSVAFYLVTIQDRVATQGHPYR